MPPGFFAASSEGGGGGGDDSGLTSSGDYKERQCLCVVCKYKRPSFITWWLLHSLLGAIKLSLYYIEA